ncbi:MAG: hypothetical protein SGILL_004924, partial [Bacillariaceae sp.]
YTSKSGSSDSKNSEQQQYPIIMVHGGPSFTHNYMLPLKQQACRGRDVYFYDQTGCGESMIPKENKTQDFPHLLDPQYYATVELPALITYWNLDKYHVVGNSWGTILLQYFELNVKPNGLVSITLSGPLSDGDLYIASQWDAKQGNLASLPPFVQQRIHHLEYTKQYDSQEYLAINDALTTYFTVRTAPGPDCWQAAEAGANKYIYDQMQGPSEFSFSGVLGHFNTTPRLHEFRVPTLLTSGAFDTMRPPCVEALYRNIPTVEWRMLRHSGHVSMIDDAGAMNDVVADFLNRVEENIGKQDNYFVPDLDACGPPGCRSKYTDVPSSLSPSLPLSSSSASSSVSAAQDGSGVFTATFHRQYPLWMIIASFCAGALVNWIMIHSRRRTFPADYHRL